MLDFILGELVTDFFFFFFRILNSISSASQMVEDFHFGGLRISSLLIADDDVVFVDFQLQC